MDGGGGIVQDAGLDGGEEPILDAGTDGGLGGTDGGAGEIDGGSNSCAVRWQGDRQWGTQQADEVNSVWVDESNNIYTVGYENGIVGQTNIEPTGDSKAVVIKYAPDGAQLWRRVIETSGTDSMEHLIGSNQGHIYAVGRTTGALSGFTNGGQFDLFALELNADGIPVRAMQSGDRRPQHPLKIGTSRDGNLVIVGYEDLYVENRLVLDSENGFVSSYVLSTAEQQWRWRSMSADNPDRVTGFTMNSPTNDELYTSGFQLFQDTESMGGAFIRRYDLDGTQRWLTQIGFTATEVDELLISPAGDLFAAGSTQLPIGGETQGLSDAYIASISRLTGEILWVSKTGTTEHDFVTAFAQSPNGDLYVAGDTFGAFGQFTNKGERDLFVLRFSTTGQLLGMWQHGTTARDHSAGLWVDSCNNVYLGGFTEGSLIEGRPPQGRDAFLIRVPMP